MNGTRVCVHVTEWLAVDESTLTRSNLHRLCGRESHEVPILVPTGLHGLDSVLRV